MLVNIPGTYRARVHYSGAYGEGLSELTAEKVEPDVLCIIQKRRSRLARKLTTVLVSALIIGIVAVAFILAAPLFSIFFLALLTWLMFCAWATEE